MHWEIDLPELQADDSLLDQLAAAEDITDPDELTVLLAAWRDDVDTDLARQLISVYEFWRRCA